MNDHDLEHLLRRAQPHLAGAAGSPAFDRGEQELLEQIMSTVPETPVTAHDDLDLVEVTSPPVRPRRSERRRTTFAVAAAAALVAVVAAPALLLGGGDADVVSGAPPVAAPATANSNPHLLLEDPAWKLTSVVESNAVTGEMQWEKGRNPLQLNWYRADLRQGYYDDRKVAAEPTKIQVLGTRADLFDTGHGSFEAILPARGDTFIMIGGRAGGRAGFLTVLGDLHPVPTETWLAAVPHSVVTPGESAGVARAMLADVPLAPGYDPATIPHDLTENYYDFGATVIGSATCAWFKVYETARTSGDEAGVARAQKALRSSSRWQVLRRMSKEGDWPWVLSQFTDRVAQGEPVGDYQGSLGC